MVTWASPAYLMALGFLVLLCQVLYLNSSTSLRPRMEHIPLPPDITHNVFPEGCVHYIVTGGAGFIGSHLVDNLLSINNACVTVLDNFHTGSRRNLLHQRGNPRLFILDWDVRERLILPAHYIFHLASPAAPEHYQRDPLYTLTTIIQGTSLSFVTAYFCRYSKHA